MLPGIVRMTRRADFDMDVPHARAGFEGVSAYADHGRFSVFWVDIVFHDDAFFDWLWNNISIYKTESALARQITFGCFLPIPSLFDINGHFSDVLHNSLQIDACRYNPPQNRYNCAAQDTMRQE